MNKGVETIIPSIARKKLEKSQRKLRHAVVVLSDCIEENHLATEEYKRVCAFQYSKGLDELG